MSENTVSCLPGWGFYPTSYELARFYLYPKVHSLPVPQAIVTDVELYKYHPAELTELQKQKHEKACYFFTPRERKYKNGSRPNRAVKENQEGQGYWKATGRDEEINDPKTKEVIALKKTLVYYNGKPGKDVKTDWIMQEYTMPSRTEQSGSAEMTIKAETRERAEASDMRPNGHGEVPPWKSSRSTWDAFSVQLTFHDKHDKDNINWIIPTSDSNQMKPMLDDWVLCKIYLNSKGTKKRRKKEQESNDDAGKQPWIDEDAWYEHYEIDEEINKLMEDGEEECIIEGQAVLPNAQLTDGLQAKQASRSPRNQTYPMQVIAPSGFSTPSVQLGERSRSGYPLLPHNQQQNFEFSSSQTTILPTSSFEPIQSSDQMYAPEAMQMMQFNATRQSMVKMEDYTHPCWPFHSQVDSITSQMPPPGENFPSQASFDEPQPAPFPDSLVSYYYESQINTQESSALETTFEQGIHATANEAQFIMPRSLLPPFRPLS